MTHILVRSALLAIVVLGTIGVPAWAQITTGVVTGAVRDDQGAVVPGATVTLLSETRGTRVAEIVTADNGDFVFPPTSSRSRSPASRRCGGAAWPSAPATVSSSRRSR